jgi:hypothetical protein
LRQACLTGLMLFDLIAWSTVTCAISSSNLDRRDEGIVITQDKVAMYDSCPSANHTVSMTQRAQRLFERRVSVSLCRIAHLFLLLKLRLPLLRERNSDRVLRSSSDMAAIHWLVKYRNSWVENGAGFLACGTSVSMSVWPNPKRSQFSSTPGSPPSARLRPPVEPC